MGDKNQFKTYSAIGLCIRARQPNFLSIVKNEYHQITSKHKVGTSESFEKFENRDKNRSHDINYVDGFEDRKKFIGTQSPSSENTLEDFYSTMWRESICIIVMLIKSTETNQNQCYQYWCEEENGVLQAGPYKMRTVKSKVCRNFVVTELHLSDESEETRQICHFAYKDCLKHNVPSDVTKFYQFILKVNHLNATAKETAEQKKIHSGPIFVHSTHCDLLSTFCTADFVLYQMSKTAWISLPNIVTRIQQQLHPTVISLEQYFFCYRIVLHFLSTININSIITKNHAVS